MTWIVLPVIAAFFAVASVIGFLPAMGLALGLCVAEILIRRILLPLLFRVVVPFVFRLLTSSGKFTYLPDLEKGLRRASQGFALMAFAVLAIIVPTVWWHGWNGLTALPGWAVNQPEDAWPVFVCAGLFAIGLIRFKVGVRTAAGARDDIKKPAAAVKLAVGVGILAFLILAYPGGQLGTFPGGFYGAMAAWSVGLWLALVGGMRFALLTITVNNALSTAQAEANRRNASMRPGRF